MASTQAAFVRRLRTVYGLDVRTRKDWGSTKRLTYAWRLINRRAKVPADTVVFHVTVTNDNGGSTGDFDADMRELEQIGTSRFGVGVSYNIVIDKDTGMVGMGQPLRAKGAHTLNDKNKSGYSHDQNYWARAIAWVALESQTTSQKCVDSFAKVLACLMDCGHVTDDPDVLPHSYFAYKSCPLPVMTAKIPSIVSEAHRLHRANASTKTPWRKK